MRELVRPPGPPPSESKPRVVVSRDVTCSFVTSRVISDSLLSAQPSDGPPRARLLEAQRGTELGLYETMNDDQEQLPHAHGPCLSPPS